MYVPLPVLASFSSTPFLHTRQRRMWASEADDRDGLFRLISIK
jgi:hypothetical protein